MLCKQNREAAENYSISMATIYVPIHAVYTGDGVEQEETPQR